ncbi:glycoside hydrolase family 85 protein [Glonium stellatum]|uniref:Glycoside hydrolase family 85 protein n=1 Tax=Glonium stellatum TaxID=574774 RepID=A0A8E2JV42_9PEZI|nr:glycoside hydrolase family 85 protein [Glonium stellatum]
MNTLGWKDILRPIRDGLRDRFPPPDNGPTPEERRKQRLLDSLKGFTYFDYFDQIEQWTAEASDPLQRANTPLLPRAQHTEDAQGKANVLLCHDFSGNYHDYESSQGIGVDEENYCCEYLQFVSTFIYFSHKLACVPPPSWTNTLHRNGVKVLGTFIVEPGTKEIERILNNSTIASPRGSRLHFPIASKLARIAHYYGFDGWLINIEKPFPKDSWDTYLLLCFLKQLKSDLGSKSRVVWYDAITVDNRIDYQNGLTDQNLSFAQEAGAILTNYCWKEDDALNGKLLAEKSQLQLQDLYFGIDVWAQNKNKTGNPRVTYPEKGGGGTNTGVAVAKLAEIGLSAGIFAPAWTFEHFPKHSRAVERSMWDGELLPDDLDCSCEKGQPHQTLRYLQYPITHFAHEYPAGSEYFFYTDFSRSFANHRRELNEIYDGKNMHSQLGAQSLLPHLLGPAMLEKRVGSGTNILYGELLHEPSRLAVWAKSMTPDTEPGQRAYEKSLCLFKLDMPADGSLQATATFRCCWSSPELHVGFYLKLGNKINYTPLWNTRGETKTLDFPVERVDGSDEASNDRLHELGIFLKGSRIGELTLLVEVIEVTIAPVTRPNQPYCIENIRTEARGEGDRLHWRLAWEYHEIVKNGRESAIQSVQIPGYPYSDITGPFAYFMLEFNGCCVGRAYALEFVLCNALVEQMKSDTGTKVRAVGVHFDGKRCESRTVILKI